jgi:hypothetical protein
VVSGHDLARRGFRGRRCCVRFALDSHGAVTSAELGEQPGVLEALLNGRAVGLDVEPRVEQLRVAAGTGRTTTELVEPVMVLGISLGNGWSRGAWAGTGTAPSTVTASRSSRSGATLPTVTGNW